jgi:hypothetical protein
LLSSAIALPQRDEVFACERHDRARTEARVDVDRQVRARLPTVDLDVLHRLVVVVGEELLPEVAHRHSRALAPSLVGLGVDAHPTAAHVALATSRNSRASANVFALGELHPAHAVDVVELHVEVHAPVEDATHDPGVVVPAPALFARLGALRLLALAHAAPVVAVDGDQPPTR